MGSVGGAWLAILFSFLIIMFLCSYHSIFICLDPPVVKSHGGTDYLGFSNSIDVCNKIVKGQLIDKINENIK